MISKLQLIKARYRRYHQTISKLVWRVYNKGLFLSNATVESWFITIVWKLNYSTTGILKSFELCISATFTKDMLIKAQFFSQLQTDLETYYNDCITRDNFFIFLQ